ncbi:MAG: hypothetical protein MUP71_02600 [Candidatus Aminicenantes bacterium]|nr:hypothetical protein [Candidatus Aminicenantes bacterium]
MNDHISGEDLAAYVDGVLVDKKRGELESHFSRCPECLEALAEIVDIQSSRVKVPGEFLQQALGEKQAVRKRVLPMRLAFEIAAAFLVVIFIGYFFLGNDRFRQAESRKKEKAAPSVSQAVPQLSPEVEKTTPVLAGRVEQAETAKTKRMPVEKNVMPAAVPIQIPEKEADHDFRLKDRENSLIDENEIREQEQKLQEAPAQPARAEMDKKGDMKSLRSRSVAAQTSVGTVEPALAAGPRAAQQAGKEMADAVLPARAKKYEKGDEEAFPAEFREAAAISSAMQLFLAATGRAATPGGMEMAVAAPRPTIRIEGDVTWSDLRDPELLAGWYWFKKGMVMELEIDSAGQVIAVLPVGQWERSMAVRATKAVRQLTFSVSAKKSRRARISVSRSSPN